MKDFRTQLPMWCSKLGSTHVHGMVTMIENLKLSASKLRSIYWKTDLSIPTKSYGKQTSRKAMDCMSKSGICIFVIEYSMSREEFKRLLLLIKNADPDKLYNAIMGIDAEEDDGK